MSQNLKVVAALVFVAVLGWVLLQPVFDAVEEAPLGAAQPPSDPDGPPVTETPRPSKTDHEPEPLPEGSRTRPLFDAYPARCLRPAPPAEDLVGVDRGDLVAAGPLSGPLEETDGVRLFGLSADGWLAWSHGDQGTFLARPGIHDTISPERGARLVVWSPVSSCGLAISRKGRLSLLLSNVILVQGGVRTVAFSPDGRKLAIVVAEEKATSLWIAPLAGDRMREIMRDGPGVSIGLRAWSPDARTLYVTSADGGLRFVTLGDPSQSGRLSPDPIEELEHCGDRLLGILDGAIVRVDRRGLHELTPEGAEYRYLSCSTSGEFIAAIGRDGLVLLDGEGRFLRDLTQDGGYTDVFVDWGSRGAGLIFGRVRADGDPTAAELWFIAEGGSPRATGITYRAGPRAVDWSASPPTGLP